MRYFPYVCLSAFFIWAASIVSADMATNKVPNARLALGARLLLLALCVLALNSWLGSRGAVSSYLVWNFYGLWGVHVLWAALAGVILWYSEVWPAGDAKFFILTAAWLPVINPLLKNFPNYLFLSLLVNTFVGAALAALGTFIASGLHKASPSDFFGEIYAGLKKRLGEMSGTARGSKLLIAAYAANMGFLFLLQQILNAESRHFLSRFLGRTDLLFFFLFFLWDKIGGAFRSKKWMYATAFCYVVYFFAGYFYFYDRLAALVLQSMLNVVRFSLLLFFGRFMLEFLMEKKDAVFVGPHELEPGMVLSSGAARTLKGNPAFEGAFDDCFKDGLTAEQAGLIKEWLRKLSVQDPRIETVKGRPFALWILVGAAITLVFDTNLVRLLKG